MLERSKLSGRLLTAAAALLLCAAPARAVVFNFTAEAGMSQEAIDGFERAGQLWSDLLDDPTTVNVNIGFRVLSAITLGSTRSERATVSYADFVDALGDQTPSADDTAAVAALQAPPAFALVLNRTANSPHGAGSAQTFLDNDGDANNVSLRLTRANAKALGLLAADDTGLDASITFNSQFNWDFEPDDGISANHFNFVYVAAHEIGHMLGFTSGVDILDINSPPEGGPFSDSVFVFVSPGDVFRTSVDSLAQGAGTLDWAADNRPKRLSIDGGATSLGEFSRGRNFGDGQQASHWRDNLGLGLMDPTVGAGEVSQITELDRRFFDIIGYELGGGTGPPVPDSNADLGVSLTADLEVSYTLVVRNDGPADVSGASVAAQVPAGLIDVTWACTPSAGATCASGGVGHVNDLADLPAGASLSYTITGTATGLDHTATVAPPGGVTDPDLSDNSAGGP